MASQTIEHTGSRSTFVTEFMHALSEKNPGETEFLQAVEECIVSLEPVLDRNPDYRSNGIINRMVEPDRMLQFRVSWMDDAGEVHVNRGYRVQFNNAIGPIALRIFWIFSSCGIEIDTLGYSEFGSCAPLTKRDS